MEGLQAVTYIFVDECGTRANELLTHLAMVHIAFQPIFINMLGMEFIDPAVKKRIKKFVYAFHRGRDRLLLAAIGSSMGPVRPM